MMVENPMVRRWLHAIVKRLAPESSWHEDLMQEALIHLWRLEEKRPGQAQCWYLQGCRFHLQNSLRRGRSVDSRKRARAQQLESDAPSDGDSPLEWPDSTESFWDEISAKDIISVLCRRLTDTEQKILFCLAEGLSAREIADRLKRSHTLVNRERRKIASVAVQLGVASEAAARSRSAAGPAQPAEKSVRAV